MRTRLLPLAALLIAAPALAQRPLDSGEPVRGSLSRTDPRLSNDSHYDEYVFEGRRGDRIEVRLESDDFDACLYLGQEGSGRWRELARDDDGGDGTDSRLRYTLPSDGRYLVRASSLRQDTGPYTLTLYGARGGYGGGEDWDDRDRGDWDDRGRGDWDDRDYPRRRNEGFIRAGEDVRDYLSRSDPRLDNGAPYHIYRYRGRRGERLSIRLGSAAFDAYLVLGTPGGRHGVATALARDDDSGGGYDAHIRYTLPHDGDFVIRVNPVSTAYGRYVLEVESSRGRWDDDRGRPGRDDDYGRIDDRLVGRWRLTARDGLRDAWGELTIRSSGEYSWRRRGGTAQGHLTRDGSRGRWLLSDGGEQYFIDWNGSSREGGLVIARRRDSRTVAYGTLAARGPNWSVDGAGPGDTLVIEPEQVPPPRR